ncbi:putative ATP-dependent RNA helicase DDX5 [Dirofilaria immitis]|nr:putative ATP-dependent RNA helicase DDX5 [Dirofilaria immitis]
MAISKSYPDDCSFHWNEIVNVGILLRYCRALSKTLLSVKMLAPFNFWNELDVIACRRFYTWSLLRHVRKGGLCRSWIALCSSSQVTASNESSGDRQRNVENVKSPRLSQLSSRVRHPSDRGRCVVMMGLVCSLQSIPAFTGGASNVLDKLGRAFGPPYQAVRRGWITAYSLSWHSSKTTNAKSSSWIDVNGEKGRRPGSFRSRNIGLDRFFDTQRQHERSAAREQWIRRSALPNRFQSSEGSWSRDIEVPKIDYRHLNLPPIQKNLYKENPSVTNRSEEPCVNVHATYGPMKCLNQIIVLKVASGGLFILFRHHPNSGQAHEEITKWFTHNEITLKGKSFPRPIFEFSEAGFSPTVIEKLKIACFQKPTVIQSISWPIALTGHDMISIARTGSGKTLAYTLPGIVHMQNQQQPENVQGPAVLILAPTRELVQQISSMTVNFHSKVACAYGGSGRDQQARAIRAGADILVAAPGRLLDFLITGTLNLNRCTYLVLDEADRMLDMGFEPQIRKIVSMIRPDRQTLMFSATWPKEVRTLAKDFLTDPVFVNVGSLKLAANNNIKQLQHCKTLIFVGMKRTADWLTRLVRKQGYPALSLHGDKSQTERNFVMNGIVSDVSDIKYVINFDCPRNVEDYIHRIGRTARHDKTGTSYTLCTFNDAPMADNLINVLKGAKQTVPSDLLELANNRRPAKSFRGECDKLLFTIPYL